MSMLASLGAWLKELVDPACKSHHRDRVPRMRWTEEFVDFYEVCRECGKEFTVDDD